MTPPLVPAPRAIMDPDAPAVERYACAALDVIDALDRMRRCGDPVQLAADIGAMPNLTEETRQRIIDATDLLLGAPVSPRPARRGKRGGRRHR